MTAERPETTGELEPLAHEVEIAVPANEPHPVRDAVGVAHVPAPTREPAAVNGLAAAVHGASVARSGGRVDTLRDATPPAPPKPLVVEEVDRDAWSPTRLAAKARSAARPARHAAKRGRRPRKPRGVRVGLAMLIVLALTGTFFAWVTAEPIWLAVGRGDSGTATVAGCVGSGLTQRCRGSFTAADGRYTTQGVRVLGVDEAQTAPGTQVRAQMVHAGSTSTYLDDRLVLTLRWLLGLLLVLLCGVGIVFATGARRLEERWARRTATVCGLAAPLLVTVGFLAASY
ncbi:hypothetical protein O7635_12840 [Asanoa sp. WMMD1127]|uniref:hypothetical protein n=1 Tax=Asanoa sp. WMMD1127 TaxID=3016107 RepID=UPI002417BE01|nr:hypothetical protein [Asanoa sp. WMMD1127]MDG4822737.1 hypothetical protein [Asanoa sp. WMMD1127]